MGGGGGAGGSLLGVIFPGGGMSKFSASGGDSPPSPQEGKPSLLCKCRCGPANVAIFNSIFFTICSNYAENNKILKVKRNFPVVLSCSTHARMICLE